MNLRATMRDPSPELISLLPTIAIQKNVMIAVFDYAFLPQFYSFYHNSLLPLQISNFVAFAMDKQSFEVIVQLVTICRFFNHGRCLLSY